MTRFIEVLWREDSWRCELDTGGIRGEGRLLVFYDAHIVFAESVHVSASLSAHAEVLRQRVLRRDLRAPE